MHKCKLQYSLHILHCTNKNINESNKSKQIKFVKLVVLFLKQIPRYTQAVISLMFLYIG
jgi:hypothetical protein